MRFNPLILASIGGLLITAPVAADEAAPAQPAAAAPKAESKLICRKETETGSILKKRRVCYTKRQWDQASAASRDSMTQGQMSGGASGQ